MGGASVVVYVTEAENGEMSAVVWSNGPHSRQDVRDAAIKYESELLEQLCMACRSAVGTPQDAQPALEPLLARLDGIRMYRKYVLDDDTTIDRNTYDCSALAKNRLERVGETA